MANRRFIDFPIAATVGNNDIVLIWQDGLNKQTTKATLLQGSPQSLAGLTDVDIAALTNGQILQYNSTTSKWENVDRTDIFLSQLGDVTIVAPANGQVLVYNSSTGKWENSSGGYVPYTGAVTTVNLGAQSILAGSFVKAGGTAAQFLKANGSVDSTAYGTGTVTSVALTMPTAFSVAGSPVTTTGTLAVTATGTTSQYIRGDGSLQTFPALTGFVPYTGATADVNLGTHDLAAERGTFTNNGSSDALTVNQTSGSGYGIIVTKGGANEALYVSKTSGSGNAMTVVGGRTSLVDLALSSVTNTAGDFLTLSGGVVHKRTAAQTLTDIGGQAALTNPVTGTGTTNYLPKFTGASTIGNSNIQDSGTLVTVGVAATFSSTVTAANNFLVNNPSASKKGYTYQSPASSWGPQVSGLYFTPNNGVDAKTTFSIELWNGLGSIITPLTITDEGKVGINLPNPDAKLHISGGATRGIRVDVNSGVQAISISPDGIFGIDEPGQGNKRFAVNTSGNVLIGTTTDNGARLQVSGSVRVSDSITIGGTDSTWNLVSSNKLQLQNSLLIGYSTIGTFLTMNLNFNGAWKYISNGSGSLYSQDSGTHIFFTSTSGTAGANATLNEKLRITNDGNVLIGTTTDSGHKLRVNGTALISSNFSCFQTTTKIQNSATSATFVLGTDYGTGMGDNTSGLVIVTINEPNANVNSAAASYVGNIINPRGANATLTQISIVLGGGVAVFTILASGNNIVVTATITGGGQYRATLNFIGSGGTS